MPSFLEQLSFLNHQKACSMLGPGSKELLIRGGEFEIDLATEARLTHSSLFLPVDGHTVTLYLNDEDNGHLCVRCSGCGAGPCSHQGAALSALLEDKQALGLAEVTPDMIPIESLSDEELIDRAIEERRERARKAKMTLKSIDPSVLWTDYILTNPNSGKSYRVALRGWQRGESYCSCPDYRVNTLGTCKHILHTIEQVRHQFRQDVLNTPYRVRHLGVYIKYDDRLRVRLLIPDDLPDAIREILAPLIDEDIQDFHGLIQRIGQVEKMGQIVHIYPDAEAYIDFRLMQDRIQNTAREIRNNPETHPLRKTLLHTELRPYQLDGIAFAVSAGRAIIADDMGLGKTIQGVGTAELLRRELNISKVLVICPASLKSQWEQEIERFTDATCRVVFGTASERSGQYLDDHFFTICNYEQVLRDITHIERVPWDLIILDEGQRIKNWEARTSQIVKQLKSPFALVLSGTPLQNRLDELYSVTQFIDDRRLGPAFRFFNRHRVVNEKGKVLGYKNLDELREKLKPVLLRRTRSDVLEDLPPRSTEILKIPPTEEQMEIHSSQQRLISSIVKKKFLTEMDLLRLQKALLICRMAANSTFLVDKEPPGFSTKLQELELLVDDLAAEEDRKIILFSEWKTMLNLIEPLLAKHDLTCVRLDGSVPQKKRPALMRRFQEDSACRFFLSTNAGSTGLNLQAANTIINVDLPWNPAVLEQRIARAHRMGQKRPVQVYLLVTEQTIEENLLLTLSAKQNLYLAALDPETDITEVNLSSGIEELKKRLEKLITFEGPKPVDRSEQLRLEMEAREIEREERLAKAGGDFFQAAFTLINEMLPDTEDTSQMQQMAGHFRDVLSQNIKKDAAGLHHLTITLPDTGALETLSRSLAKMALAGSELRREVKKPITTH